MVVDTKLYDILEVHFEASAEEIKKSYKRLALLHHPDKAPIHEKEEAAERFRGVQEAYDILKDPESREMYDMYGMNSDSNGQFDGGVNLDDVLAQMFGMNFEAGGPGKNVPRDRKRRGSDVIHDYEISLEDMFKGKEVKLRATRNTLCPRCQGRGGKRFAKEKPCLSCDGKGVKQHLKHVGPHHVTNSQVICDTCNGKGVSFRGKDRCKHCKGSGTVPEQRMLSFFVNRSAKENDKIIQRGMADEAYGITPGDVILQLHQKPHPVFERLGDDLKAKLKISLAEALTGFNRVILTTLDGRGLEYVQPIGKILHPGDCLIIPGEGMYKDSKTDLRGDLYLEVDIEFPKDGSIGTTEIEILRDILPSIPKVSVMDDTLIDSVRGVPGDISHFGGDARYANEDYGDETYEGVPECQAQ
ncbi:DNAJ protein Xdj1 [Schizosaccharomyces pombe]